MSDPLVTPDELATFLGLASIDEDRATMLLDDAQTLCESILDPLPDTAAGIIRRIAARGYTNINSAQTMELQTAKVGFGATAGGYAVGGIYLSRADKADLRRLGGGGNAFSINLLPADYALDLPFWDVNGEPIVETS